MMALVVASIAVPAVARASVLFDRLSPTPSTTNSVGVTVTFLTVPKNATSTVQSASFIDLHYDTDSHQLTVADADLLGSNVSFTWASLTMNANNLRVQYAPDLPSAPIPTTTVDANSGAFSNLNVPVRFTGSVSVNGGSQIPAIGDTTIVLSGTFTYDPSDGSFALTNVTGTYGPLLLQITQSVSVSISGSTTFNFDAAAPIDEIPGNAKVGGALTLTGRGFTPGSLLKVFVATSNGVVDVIPNGLAPNTVAADGTTGTWNLPWPWPVAAPNDVLVGNGYASAFLVRSDFAYSLSNTQGVVLLGNANLNPKVPSITGIGGTALSATSSQESIATANVEALITPNAQTTIQGEGFVSPVVNIFSASGNCAPGGGIVPTSSTTTSITFTVPAGCPVGPGSVQVINATGSFLASNAVSIPISELVTVSSVQVNGGTVTVNGTGFSSLTVINLFGSNGSTVINAGGLNGGDPNIPLTLVDSHQFTFTRPGSLVAGSAFLQAINPPFIPFTNSGTGAAGSFVLP